MKKEWSSRSLEDCLAPVAYTRKIQRRNFLAEGRFPIVSQEAEFINGYWSDERDLFRVSRPVIVFGDHTKTLKYIDFDFVLGADGVKILKPREFLLPRFLYYRIAAEELGSLGYSRHYRLLKRLKVPIPPLTEQERIVILLDEAFASLATARANAERNLQNARVLLESHLHSLFLGLAKRCTSRPLGEFCAFENGDRGANYPSKSTRTATGIPFINAGHLTDDGLDLKSMDYIPRSRFDILSKGKVRKGDILFCLRGSLGKFASVGDLDEGAIASSLVIVRPDDTVLNEFLLAYFRSPITTEMINRYKNGAAQPNLSAQSLRRFIAPTPVLSEQVSIVRNVEGLRDETRRLSRNYESTLRELEALERALLRQAFAGELH